MFSAVFTHRASRFFLFKAVAGAADQGLEAVRQSVVEGGTSMRDSREIQILVVDDDLALCELLRTTFELEGMQVLEAHHVIESEQLLVERRPDAIVLDIGLPGVDGIFYCERLRESPQTRNIPIVAISGSQEAGA